MRNTWLIALREFLQRVRSRGFILGSIALPLFFLVFWFIGGNFMDSPPDADAPVAPAAQPVGYIDLAGLIQPDAPVADAADFRRFPDEAAAAQALAAGEIDRYYVIPADYREEGELLWVGPDIPVNPPANAAFERVLVASILPDRDAASLQRLRQPFNAVEPVYISSLEETAGGSQPTFTPFIVAMLVMTPLFTSGGYLLQSLTQEKSSRMMEILLATVRPRQLLTGKLLGLGALILVQYLIWGVLGLLLALATGANVAQIGQVVSLTPAEILAILPYALGGFFLYAGLTAGIGALAPNLEASRTWIFLITLPMMVPIYVWVAIVSAPNGALAVTLSLFPFSAPIAMLMRLTSATVPAWQIAVSLVLLGLTAVGVLLLMARLFRAQTLLSGEPLSLRRMATALRG